MKTTKAYTLMEILVTVSILAVLAVVVSLAMSNYTHWGKVENGKRTVRLLNDALSRYKNLAPAEKFALLYDNSGQNPLLVGNAPHGAIHNKSVVEAMVQGFVKDGVDQKFLSSQSLEWDKLTSTGSGDDFWFAEYGSGLTNDQLPTDIVLTAGRNHAFSYTIAADRSKPLTFSSTGMVLPASVPFTLSQHGGVITGTPTNIGTYKFTVSVNDGTVYTRNITLNVVEGLPILNCPTSATFYTGIVDTFNISAGAINEPTKYGATPLTGFTLNENTGVITAGAVPGASNGTEWHYTMNVSATNSAGTSSKDVDVTVILSVPKITSASTLTAFTGRTFTFQVTGEANVTAFTTTTLPAWLSFTSDGKLTGTPPSNGTTQLDLFAYNDAGKSNPQTFTLTVEDPPNPVTAIIPAE